MEKRKRILLFYPCVAQPGRAPGLGPGGRMFESCHTDQILAFIDGVEKDKLSITNFGGLV